MSWLEFFMNVDVRCAKIVVHSHVLLYIYEASFYTCCIMIKTARIKQTSRELKATNAFLHDSEDMPKFRNLKDFYEYVKSNREHVYRYRAVNVSHDPIRVSIQHPSRTFSTSGVHQVDLSKGTRLSFKCSTEEIHALFLAMLNFRLLNETEFYLEDRDVHRVGMDDCASLYLVSQSLKGMWDESLNNENGDYQQEFEKLVQGIRKRIKKNKFTYRADIHDGGGVGVHKLKIVISPVADDKIKVKMSYKRAPPGHFKKFKYEFDKTDMTTLAWSLGDMLSHIPGDSLSKIFRKDILGKNNIKNVEIRSKIPKHPFGDVRAFQSTYVGVDPENKQYKLVLKKVDENEKGEAIKSVFGEETAIPQVQKQNSDSDDDDDGGSVSGGSSSHDDDRLKKGNDAQKRSDSGSSYSSDDSDT